MVINTAACDAGAGGSSAFLGNFHALQVVDRGSETKLQVGENSTFKGTKLISHPSIVSNWDFQNIQAKYRIYYFAFAFRIPHSAITRADFVYTITSDYKRAHIAGGSVLMRSN